MTRIIISDTKEGREVLLLKQVSELLRREFNMIVDILKIPDIHYLTTVENSLGIEEVKKFVQSMMFKPFQEIYQIAIIDNAEKLTTEAQNSLLKTLEESGDSTVFFLLTSSEGLLLDTIRSRGSLYYGDMGNNHFESEVVGSFLELDTAHRLRFVEKLGAEKERDEIVLFLNSLLEKYKVEFEEGIVKGERNPSIVKKISEIEGTLEAIKGNVNKKLALYNMVVQMGE
ncbi:hypothetical protein HYV12_00455 [Candidatus Dojkabacteria bacterium]|nr:hypothetical protein [Candidatus Dojkabacteria bacterium]